MSSDSSNDPFDNTRSVGADDLLSAKSDNIAEHKVDLTGQTIGPFRVLEILGEGGMGSVYLAEQRKPIKRQVALKVIKAGMDSKQVVARFEAERQALALMNHENVAKVLDAGTTDQGLPYFAMELVRGTPITQFCDQNKLSVNERLELFRKVCNAVQHAHQKGVIHRDLKPNNILVTTRDDKPVPKVIDFGLAKATSQPLTEQTMFTGHGQILGTPEYMSPEQTRTHEQDIDTRTDIYSLGVILYELLTGSTPLKRESFKKVALAAIINRIQDEEPERPSSRLENSKDSIESVSSVRQIDSRKFAILMKGELDWIVMKAIEKERARRYETASEFSTDIERFLNHEPVLARPPSASYRVKKFVGKNRGLVAAVLSIFFLLVAGIGGTSSALKWALDERRTAVAEQKRANNEADRANTNKNLAESEAKSAVEARNVASDAQHAAEQTAADSDFLLAVSRWEDGRAGDAADLLARIPKRYRDVEWRIAHRLVEGTPYVHFSQLPMAAFKSSTIENCVFAVDKAGTIWKFDCSSGAVTVRGQVALAEKEKVGWAEFTDDCSKLAIATSRERIGLWNVEDGNCVFEEQNGRLNYHRNHVSSDGAFLANHFVNGEFNWECIKVTNTETGNSSLVSIGEKIRAFHFHPTSSLLCVATDQEYSLHNVNTGNKEKSHRLSESIKAGITEIAFSASGRYVALTTGHNLEVFETENGKSVLRTSPGSSARFSPCESKIAICGYTPNSHQSPIAVRILPLNGEPLQNSFWLSSPVLRAAEFTADGQFLVTCTSNRKLLDGTSAAPSSIIKFWPVTNGNERGANRIKQIGLHEGVRSISLSRDGNYVAMFWTDLSNGSMHPSRGLIGNVAVFDLTNGDKVVEVPRAKNAYDFSFDSESVFVVSVANGEEAVQRWSLSSQGSAATLDLELAETTFLKCNPLNRSFVSVSRNRAMQSGSEEAAIDVWDFSGTQQGRILLEDKELLAIDFSPNGNSVVGATMSGKTLVWNLETCELQHDLKSGLDLQVPAQVGFSHDGREVLVSDVLNSITFLDLSSGSISSSGKWGTLGRGRFSRFNTSNRLLLENGSSIKLVDPKRDFALLEIPTAKKNEMLPGFLMVHPDDKRLIYVADGRLSQWSWETGFTNSRLLKHPSPVVSVLYEPVGSTIFTGALDGKIRAWNPDTGELVKAMSGFNGVPRSIEISPDRNKIAIMAWDKELREHSVQVVDIGSGRHLCAFATKKVKPPLYRFDKDSQKLSVRSMPDSKGLHTDWVLDLQTGETLQANDSYQFPSPHPGRVVTQGRWYPIIRGKNVRLYDLAGYDNGKLLLPGTDDSYLWHQFQAETAELDGDHFASLFHRAWSLYYQPDSRLAYEQFQQTMTALEQSGVAPPEIAIQVLSLNKPELTESELQWMRDRLKRIGDAIYTSDKSVAETNILQLRIVARNSQLAEDQLRLAAAEFRLGSFNGVAETLARVNIDELNGKQAIIARCFKLMSEIASSEYQFEMKEQDSFVRELIRNSLEFDKTCHKLVDDLISLAKSEELDSRFISQLKHQRFLSDLEFRLAERRRGIDAGCLVGRPPVNRHDAEARTEFFSARIHELQAMENLSGIALAHARLLRAYCYLMLRNADQANEDLAAVDDVDKTVLEDRWLFCRSLCHMYKGEGLPALQGLQALNKLESHSRIKQSYEALIALASLEVINDQPAAALAVLQNDFQAPQGDVLPLTIGFLAHVKLDQVDSALATYAQLQSAIEKQRKSESETLSYYRAGEANFHFIDSLKYLLVDDRQEAWDSYLRGVRWLPNRSRYQLSYRNLGMGLMGTCQEKLAIDRDVTSSFGTAIDIATSYHFEADQLEFETSGKSTSGQQNMLECGPYWTNDTYRVWGNNKKDGFLLLKIESPNEGRFRLFARLTRTFDFGIIQFQVNDHEVGQEFDLFNRLTQTSKWGVTYWDEFDLGTVRLRKGTNSIKIVCVDRNFASGGYLAGVDYFSIWPAELVELDSNDPER